jgi:hypothetical protein
VSSFALWATRDPSGVPGGLLFGTQREPPLNEKEADMADSLISDDCPFDEPCDVTGVDATDWDAVLLDQVGEFDAFGPFSDRDAYPGPE